MNTKTRTCRICSKPLTLDRYFNCLKCKPTLSDDDEPYTYCGSSNDVNDDVSLDELQDIFGDGDEPT